jgi:hypothetical protein
VAKKEKSLCEWKKNSFEDDLDRFREMVANPQFYCRKCGRVAAKRKWLCKAARLHPENRSPVGTG